MDYGRMGLTSATVVTVGGVAMGAYVMVVVAVVLIAVAAGAMRLGWRRGRALDDR